MIARNITDAKELWVALDEFVVETESAANLLPQKEKSIKKIIINCITDLAMVAEGMRHNLTNPTGLKASSLKSLPLLQLAQLWLYVLYQNKVGSSDFESLLERSSDLIFVITDGRSR